MSEIENNPYLRCMHDIDQIEAELHKLEQVRVNVLNHYTELWEDVAERYKKVFRVFDQVRILDLVDGELLLEFSGSAFRKEANHRVKVSAETLKDPNSIERNATEIYNNLMGGSGIILT